MYPLIKYLFKHYFNELGTRLTTLGLAPASFNYFNINVVVF